MGHVPPLPPRLPTVWTNVCLLFCCFRFNITQTRCRRRFTFHTRIYYSFVTVCLSNAFDRIFTLKPPSVRPSVRLMSVHPATTAKIVSPVLDERVFLPRVAVIHVMHANNIITKCNATQKSTIKNIMCYITKHWCYPKHKVDNEQLSLTRFLDPIRRVPKSHSSCSSCCCYQFSKNLQSFLNTQRSATKLCIYVHIRANTPHRSTVSDFPLIFQLMSNYLIACSRYCAIYCRRTGRSACSAACITARLLQHGARWSVVMNIYAQAGLTAGI